jgi:hypothetical protein
LEFSQAAREVNGNHGNFAGACDGEVSEANVEHFTEKRGERHEVTASDRLAMDVSVVLSYCYKEMDRRAELFGDLGRRRGVDER